MTILNQTLEENNKTCEHCKKTFTTYQSLTYHLTHQVCKPIVKNATTLTTTNVEATNTLPFGSETIDHVNLSVVIETFTSVAAVFNPVVIKHIYFNNDAPQNMNVMYLCKNRFAVKCVNGWESRNETFVQNSIIHLLLFKLLKRSDVVRITEVDDEWRKNHQWWNDFHDDLKPLSIQYRTMAKNITDVIRDYTTRDMISLIQPHLNTLTM